MDFNTEQSDRHILPEKSSSSSTCDGSQGKRSSGGSGSHRIRYTSTASSTEFSYKDDIPLDTVSIMTNFGTDDIHAARDTSVPGDDYSGSSQMNVSGKTVLLGETINCIIRNAEEDESKRREEIFKEQFQSVDDVFVETKGYAQAKEKLEKNHTVLITGSSGAGTTLIAKKLVNEKILQGYTLKEIDNVAQLRQIHWKNQQIVLMDDLFGYISNRDDENQKLVSEIGFVIEERRRDDGFLYVVMTCRRSVIQRIKPCLKSNRVLDKSNIVDLSEFKLSQQERLQILEKHLKRYRPNENLDQTIKQAISKCKLPGYPNCVYMFTRNDKLFNQGKHFFIFPTEHVQEEIHVLRINDPDVYALLLFILIKDGEIKEKTLQSLGDNCNEFHLLQNIAHFPSAIQLGLRLHSALKRVDAAFVTQESSTIQFRHSCVLEAMCLSFSQTLENQAVKWLPFDFIVKRIRTDKFEKSNDYEIVTIGPSVFDDLAERFINEIKFGNIAEVCKHEAFTNGRFVTTFCAILEGFLQEDVDMLRFILQVTERENHLGALFNGSLLYWSASLKAELLCSSLLAKHFYDNIKDKFWVRIQASAALVPACWYGFQETVLDSLLQLDADINSAIHKERRSQTHFCDFCTVHDQDGMSGIQASVFTDNLPKYETLAYLLTNGACFKEGSDHKPLIKAIQIYDTALKSDLRNIAKKTIHALLNGGADVNLKDRHEKTALWYAVFNDSIDIVELLIAKSQFISSQSLLPFSKSIEMVKLIEQHGIDRTFDQTDTSGKSLLHRVQHESLISYFISKGCSLERRDRNGRTPLFYSHTPAIYKELIARGSSINITDNDDKTIFHFIKRHDILECILSTSSDEDIHRNINKVDKLTRTPIFSCTSQNIIKLFLEHHADVNHQAEKCSASESETTQGECIYDVSIDPTTKLTKPSNIYSARFILSLQDCPSEVLSNEARPFDEATNTIYTGHHTSDISSESLSSTKSLNGSTNSENSNGENFEDPDTKNYTVTMKLALTGKLTVEIVDLLISYGADFSLKDCEDKSILHCILAPENKIRQVADVVQKVLGASKSKDILNLQDAYGNTALHLASSCKEINKLPPENKTAVIEILLKNGAKIHLLNSNNETPLHCLLKCNCLGKYDALVLIANYFHGTLNVYCPNQRGEVPLEHLCLIMDQSKHFITDARKTIIFLYKNELLKDYLLSNLDFVFKDCNIALLDAIVQCCPEILSRESEELINYFKNRENFLIVRFWVLLSFIDIPERSVWINQLKLEVDESHSLLRDCILQIHESERLTAVLETLLNHVSDINSRTKEEKPLLITAIMACRYKRSDTIIHRIVRVFLNLGADPNVQDKDGLTPFHHCILSSARDERVLKCADLLREKKAKFDIGSSLLLACDINRLRTKTIKCLPSSVLPYQKDEKGNALHHLVLAYSKYGRSFRVSTSSLIALVDRGVDINMYNDDGETPLHVAMKQQVMSHVIIELLRNGADVNKKKHLPVNGNTNPEKDCKALHKLEETCVNDESRSAFQYMLLYLNTTNMAVVREMLKYGADPFHKDIHGQNSFHHITSMIRPNSLKILLMLLHKFENSQREINIQDNYGNTPLHNACTFGNNDKVWCTSLRVAVIRILLAKGVNLNEVNRLKQTPFHLLIFQYHKFVTNYRSENEKFVHNIVALISLFLSYDVDMEIKDQGDKSALAYVEMWKLNDIKQLIDNEMAPEDLFRLFEVQSTTRSTTEAIVDSEVN
ncbi:uncharacterized protein LOC127720141 [Mytilus californianus]|uniref:uncharacterized protein LOC127720141 n=1 Tax=Mytilus californianus TaxID=6549 RepID=UPI0022472CE2|nr:uncharacterized protein LOC127720141 [Mytilus californianus]